MNEYIPNLEIRYVGGISQYAEMRDLLAQNAQSQLGGKGLISMAPHMNSAIARRGELERGF